MSQIKPVKRNKVLRKGGNKKRKEHIEYGSCTILVAA